MKYAYLIEHRRDGSERPLNEQHMLHSVTNEAHCSECHVWAVCGYEIQADAFFCSDECRAIFMKRLE